MQELMEILYVPKKVSGYFLKKGFEAKHGIIFFLNYLGIHNVLFLYLFIQYDFYWKATVCQVCYAVYI